MRPRSIIWFELLYLGSLAAAILSLAVDWDELTATFSPALAAAVMGGTLLLIGLLVLLASRKGSIVAKWLLVGLFVLGLTSFLPVIGVGMDALDLAWYDWVGWIAQAVATGLLFTPSARDWMRRRRDPAASSAGLERTFE